MGPKKIGSYLDSGSLGLFIQQILKILAGSVAAAIHDIDYVQRFAIARPRPLTEVLAEMGPAVRFDKELNLVRINS